MWIRLSDFISPVVIMGLGIFIMVGFTRPDFISIEETKKIEGFLSKNPAKETYGENKHKIILSLSGFDNVFEFSGCAYNTDIAEKVTRLRAGDHVTLFVSGSSSHRSWTWQGKEYNTYLIYEAYAQSDYTILNVDQYNDCQSKGLTSSPIFGGLTILFGLFQFFKVLYDKNTLMDTKYLALRDGEDSADSKFVKLKPDRLSYIGSNSGFPFMFLVFGLIIELFNGPNNKFALFLMGFGVITFLHYVISYGRIYYVIDSEGIHIKSISFFFFNEIETIKFNSIKEVICDEEGVFDSDRKVSTVKIHTGNVDEDGGKIYSKLIGIKKGIEITEFIKQQSGLK